MNILQRVGKWPTPISTSTERMNRWHEIFIPDVVAAFFSPIMDAVDFDQIMDRNIPGNDSVREWAMIFFSLGMEARWLHQQECIKAEDARQQAIARQSSQAEPSESIVAASDAFDEVASWKRFQKRWEDKMRKSTKKPDIESICIDSGFGDPLRASRGVAGRIEALFDFRKANVKLPTYRAYQKT